MNVFGGHRVEGNLEERAKRYSEHHGKTPRNSHYREEVKRKYHVR